MKSMSCVVKLVLLVIWLFLLTNFALLNVDRAVEISPPETKRFSIPPFVATPKRVIEIPKKSTVEFEDNEDGRKAKLKADTLEARKQGKSISGMFTQRVIDPEISPGPRKELKQGFPKECVVSKGEQKKPDKNGMIVILGSNPTAICAAHRLLELGHKNWKMIPAKEEALTKIRGGLLSISGYSWIQLLFDSKLNITWSYKLFNDSVIFDDLQISSPFLQHIYQLPLKKREFFRYSIQSLRTKKSQGCTLTKFLDRVFGESFSFNLQSYFTKIYPTKLDELTAKDAFEFINEFDPSEVLYHLSSGKSKHKPPFIGREPEDWTNVWNHLQNLIPNEYIQPAVDKIDIQSRSISSVTYSALISSISIQELQSMLDSPTRISSTHLQLFVFVMKSRRDSQTRHFLDADVCFFKVVTNGKLLTAFSKDGSCKSTDIVKDQLRQTGIISEDIMRSEIIRTSAVMFRGNSDTSSLKGPIWFRPPDIVHGTIFSDCQRGKEAVDSILGLPESTEPTFYGHHRQAERFTHDTSWKRHLKLPSVPLQSTNPLCILLLQHCDMKLIENWQHKESLNRVIYVLSDCDVLVTNILSFPAAQSVTEFLTDYESLFPLGSIVSIEIEGSLLTIPHFNPRAVSVKLSPDLVMPGLIIAITPTYPRDNRAERLCRLGHYLAQDLRVKWLIVEDGAERNLEVLNMLHQFDGILDWEYLFIGPSEGKGHVQRDHALNYIRDHGLKGQVYFMDDDNRYDDDLFSILRELEPMRVGIIAVGNLHDGVERPLFDSTGKFIKFHAFWKRKFMVDMAGFTFDAAFLDKLEQPLWKNYLKGGESQFISRLIKGPSELQPLGNLSTIVPVSHNRPMYWEHSSTCIDHYASRRKQVFTVF